MSLWRCPRFFVNHWKIASIFHVGSMILRDPNNIFVNPNLNVVCTSKGALSHDSKLADGTKVIRLDDMDSFLVEVAEKKVTERTRSH